MKSYLQAFNDSMHDEILMLKVCRVINSVNDDNQLLALRRYLENAKNKMKVKEISNKYIDIYYAECRDRVMSDNKKYGRLYG